MQVIFGFEHPSEKVISVFWDAKQGVAERLLRVDGSVVDKVLHIDSLAEVYARMASSVFSLYSAEVSDLRTAFKYLGKAKDLVELLPEINFDARDKPTSDAP